MAEWLDGLIIGTLYVAAFVALVCLMALAVYGTLWVIL